MAKKPYATFAEAVEARGPTRTIELGTGACLIVLAALTAFIAAAVAATSLFLAEGGADETSDRRDHLTQTLSAETALTPEEKKKCTGKDGTRRYGVQMTGRDFIYCGPQPRA